MRHCHLSQVPRFPFADYIQSGHLIPALEAFSDKPAACPFQKPLPHSLLPSLDSFIPQALTEQLLHTRHGSVCSYYVPSTERDTFLLFKMFTMSWGNKDRGKESMVLDGASAVITWRPKSQVGGRKRLIPLQSWCFGS